MDKNIVANLMKSAVRYAWFLINLISSYVYDCSRYIHFSATFYNKSIAAIEGKIIAHTHVIEKGLSHSSMKLGFGQDIVRNLIKLLKKYSAMNFDTSSKMYLSAVSVLNKYVELHNDKNFCLNDIDDIIDDIEEMGRKIPFFNSLGGTIEISKDYLLSKAKMDFKQVALSRFSIRDFSDKDVDIKTIEEAVTIAQKSPSVCNRQATKVYVVSDHKRIADHLSYQNGNRGFGHKINKLLIVTSNLNYFEGTRERNQSFIDAGIFTMSLLYALHYLSIGAITLNWCVTKKQDQDYRKMSNINNCENIILMIGVGHIPDVVRVPKSERKELKEIITYI